MKIFGRFVPLFIAVFLGAITLCATAANSATTTAVRKIVLTDFEDAPRIALRGEGVQPESRVLLTRAPVHSGTHAARLDYTFRANIKAPRQYVELAILRPLAGSVQAISARIFGDASKQTLKLRLTDKTGETFQFGHGMIDWTGWKRVVFPMDRNIEVAWGGNNDRKIDAPVHDISFLVDSPIEPYHGRIVVDDVEYTTTAPPTAFVAVRFSSAAAGNAFYNRIPELTLEARNLDPEKAIALNGSVQIVNLAGAVVAQVPRTLSIAPRSRSRATLRPALHDFGLYHAIFVTDIGSKVLAQKAFSYLPEACKPVADPASIFGVSMHFGHGSRGPIDSNLQLASDLGLRRLRDDGSWYSIERKPGVYTVPETFDRFLRTALPRWGCDPLIILDYSNPLYEKERSVRTPEGRRAYAAWGEYMARTYQDTIRYWEVWNEPNISFWKPKPNPVDYAALLKSTYPAVKRGNPNAIVVAMCTAGIDYKFIESVLKQNTKGFFDAVSVHPYRYPRAPEGAPSLVGDLRKLIALLDRYGVGNVPILLTEIGWPNQKDKRGLPEAVSADYLARLYLLVSQFPQIHGVYWYDFQNDGTRKDYNENNFGLLHNDFTPKAPAVALRMTSRALHKKHFVRKILDGPNVYAFEFADRTDRRTVAAWSATGGGSLSLRWPGNDSVRTVSALGPVGSTALDAGVLALPLTGTPVFITGHGTPQSLPPILELSVQGKPYPGHPLRVTAVVNNPWDVRMHASLVLYAPEGWQVKTKVPHFWRVGKNVRSLTLQVPHDAKPGEKAEIRADLLGTYKARVGTAVIPVTVAPLVTARLEPVRTPQGRVIHLVATTDLSPPPAVRAITLQCPAAWGGLVHVPKADLAAWEPGKGTSQVDVAVPVTSRLPRPAITEVSATIQLADGNTVAVSGTVDFWDIPRRGFPRIDDVAAWKDVPAAPAAIFDGPHKDRWKGKEDASANIAVAWDRNALYLRADVTDDKHVQPASDENIWKGDSIQFGIDLHPDTRPGDAPWTEIGAALGPNGPVVFRWTEPEGVVKTVVCRIQRTGTHTRYFLAVPWRDLGADSAPTAWARIGFAAVVNDNDGDGRDGWLVLFDGVGWRKAPEKFGSLFLKP